MVNFRVAKNAKDWRKMYDEVQTRLFQHPAYSKKHGALVCPCCGILLQSPHVFEVHVLSHDPADTIKDKYLPENL